MVRILQRDHVPSIACLRYALDTYRHYDAALLCEECEETDPALHSLHTPYGMRPTLVTRNAVSIRTAAALVWVVLAHRMQNTNGLESGLRRKSYSMALPSFFCDLGTHKSQSNTGPLSQCVTIGENTDFLVGIQEAVMACGI